MRTNKITAAILFLIFFIACNSTKQINKDISNRDKDGRQVKIEQPKVYTATPDNINMVYDFEQIYSPTQVRDLDSLVRVFEKSNQVAIKVVTIGNDKVPPTNFDKNNRDLLKEWDGVHGKVEKTMVISISKVYGKTAIDYGSFVGKLFSANEKNNIIETAFTPAFQNGQYYMGVWNGVNAIMNTIRKNISFNPQPVSK